MSLQILRSKRFLGIVTLAIVLTAVFAIWGRTALRPALPSRLSLTIALPVQVASSALFVAEDRKIFAEHSLSVSLRPFLLGKQALQNVLDGHADLALVADTPFALAVLRGEQIATVATVFESRRTMAVFAPKKSGITDFQSLVGKTVGTVIGTNAEYFLDTMLDVHGIKRDAISVIGFKPEELAQAITAGKVDAVTMWNPDLARAEQQYGALGSTIYGEDFFVYRFLLVGKKSFIDSHPTEIYRILAALNESNALINAQSERSRALVGKRLGMDPDLLARSFNPIDFTLTLDQPLLLALSDQKRWAVSRGMVKQGEVDFLDYLRPAPLTALAPDANKMIR